MWTCGNRYSLPPCALARQAFVSALSLPPPTRGPSWRGGERKRGSCACAPMARAQASSRRASSSAWRVVLVVLVAARGARGAPWLGHSAVVGPLRPDRPRGRQDLAGHASRPSTAAWSWAVRDTQVQRLSSTDQGRASYEEHKRSWTRACTDRVQSTTSFVVREGWVQ